MAQKNTTPIPGITKNPASLAAAQKHLEQAFANIATAERGIPEPPSWHASVRPGEISLANEALFVEGNFNEPLTNYAVGFRDPSPLEEDLEFIAPAIPTPRWLTYAEWSNAEEFQANPDEDLRAIGSDFARVVYTSKKVPAKVPNRGLTIRVDVDQISDPANANWQQAYVAKLLRRIKRNSLLRGIRLLNAVAINTPMSWVGATGENPDGNIREMIRVGADWLGFRANRAFYGDAAWDARVSSSELQNTPTGYAGSLRTPEQLAAYLRLRGVRISEERYSSGSTSKAEMVGNAVYTFFTESGADVEDASNIKRFVAPTQQGGPFAVYVQQHGPKLWDITVEHYELTKITCPLGIRMATITAA